MNILELDADMAVNWLVLVASVYGAGFGLGGWGTLALARLKRLFRAERAPENFRFLAMDTVTPEEKLQTGDAGLREEDLSIIASERMRVALRAGSDFKRKDHPDLAAIIPEDVEAIVRDPAVTKDGAQAIRCVGAGAVYWAWHEARARVRDKVLRSLFTDIDPNAGKEPDNQLFLYVFASVCGGSGSGMLIPFGMMLRDLKDEAIHVDYRTVAILALPEVFSSPTQRNMANCYATLMELNYYMRPDTEFPLPWTGRSLTEAPFDYVYLLPPSNGVIQLANPQRAAELAALFAFHSFQD